MHIEVTYIDTRRDENGWEHHAWRVNLALPNGMIEVSFRTGLGVSGEPEAEMVLSALLSDAASIGLDGTPVEFEEWALDYGFDPDSRRAFALYEQAVEQTRGLRDAFGDEWRAVVSALEHDDVETVARRLARA